MIAVGELWQRFLGRAQTGRVIALTEKKETNLQSAHATLSIEDSDPLIAFLITHPKPHIVDQLHFTSFALEQLKTAGVQLIVPLISHGELLGLVQLGERRSEQAYSADDRKFLGDLASQAAPAVRVAQLLQERQAEASERSRIAQELQVARLIQQTLLPQTVPQRSDWAIQAHYQPAREVGGDFYDFYEFEDGRIGIVIGDVTDKGVPAALVMATTRALLRNSAEQLIDPSAVLTQVNSKLLPDMPPRMFVTCLYLVIDPQTGSVTFANAGHSLPQLKAGKDITKLAAKGMPLGLLPNMRYEAATVQIGRNETLLCYSDGLIEARDTEGTLFGLPRLQHWLAAQQDNVELPALLDQLIDFATEPDDDVTLVSIARRTVWEPLGTLSVASKAGVEQQVAQQVTTWVEPYVDRRIEKLKMAVAEAVMNAVEHGNATDPNRQVQISVAKCDDCVRVEVMDEGFRPISAPTEQPDLAAKIRGEQSARGWGLFLIEKMVDELAVAPGKLTLRMNIEQDESR